MAIAPINNITENEILRTNSSIITLVEDQEEGVSLQ